MDFLKLAKKRYSTRQFQSKKVERQKIEAIINAAHVAPTAANLQPQKLLMLDDSGQLSKLAPFVNFYNAPVVMIVLADTSCSWKRHYDKKYFADIDCAIVTDHMMLEATSLGLGSVWIGNFSPEDVKKEFSIPQNLDVFSILAIGYAEESTILSPERHSQTRKPISELIYNTEDFL